MRLTVFVVQAPQDADALEHLRRSLDADIELVLGPELPDPADYDLLVTGRPAREHLTASPRLQALIIPWAGLPESTHALMTELPNLTVHNLHHNALPVAEHALALLLAAAKFIVPMDRALRGHDWRPRYRPSPSLLLAGKTALVLGYGAIGKHAARLCRGLGMEVIAVSRRGAGTAEGLASIDELAELLPRTDALLVCLPHTQETTGLLGAQELALLPPTALLVNVGRGAVVEEAALYHALRDRKLYAAGLDVWYNYPADKDSRAGSAPSGHPFHELDNVVMSPHRAGNSIQTEYLRMTHLADLLNAAARGEPMPNQVDLKIGY